MILESFELKMGQPDTLDDLALGAKEELRSDDPTGFEIVQCINCIMKHAINHITCNVGASRQEVSGRPSSCTSTIGSSWYFILYYKIKTLLFLMNSSSL